MIRKLISFPLFVSINIIILLTLFYSDSVKSLGFVNEVPLNSIFERSIFLKGIEEGTFLKQSADSIMPEIDDLLGKEMSAQKDKEEKPIDFDIINGVIERGGNFYTVLKKNGLIHEEILDLVKTAKPFHNINKVSFGTPFDLKFIEDKFAGLSYEIDKYWKLFLTKAEEGFTARLDPIPYDTHIVVKEGIIQDNLFNTVLRIDEAPEIAFTIADIFAWDIDFFKDLRKGDRLKVVLRKKFRDGEFLGYEDLLAAEFINKGKRYTALYFAENNAYYTFDGEPIKKQFLRAPLKFSRISSGFNPNRYHPILKKKVPHFGVDYVAPIGTPVHSVSDGIISFAGDGGPSGNLIRIKHNSSLISSYCHLKDFGRGIKVGTEVKQGQIIGSVGMSGRTTGPHLDFQIKKNGKPINPLKFKSPQINPVSREQFASFRKTRSEVVKLFASHKNDTDSLTLASR